MCVVGVDVDVDGRVGFCLCVEWGLDGWVRSEKNKTEEWEGGEGGDPRKKTAQGEDRNPVLRTAMILFYFFRNWATSFQRNTRFLLNRTCKEKRKTA